MEKLQFKNLTWINTIDPTKEELIELQKEYHFHDLDIEDCISKREQSKIEIHQKHLFLILKFPVLNRRTQLVETSELNIFLGKNFVITAHDGKMKHLEEIFAEAREKPSTRKRLFQEGMGKFLWSLLKALFKDIFPMIDRMGVELKKMEMEVFESRVLKNQLKNILIFKRNLINLHSIIAPQKRVLETMGKEEISFLKEDLHLFFSDILDKIEKILETTTVLQDLVGSLRDANETMLTHSLNNTMKALTFFSAVMLPLTFITGLFGMNVPLPFAHDPLIFYGILAAMFSVGVVMILFSKWRRWI